MASYQINRLEWAFHEKKLPLVIVVRTLTQTFISLPSILPLNHFQLDSLLWYQNQYPACCLLVVGALQLDRRVTDKMLRWVLVDIKRSKEPRREGIMTIRDDHVKFQSYTDSSDVLLEHNVHSISQFCRCQRDRRCLFYLQRNAIDAPFVMFAYSCEQEDKVGLQWIIYFIAWVPKLFWLRLLWRSRLRQFRHSG